MNDNLAKEKMDRRRWRAYWNGRSRALGARSLNQSSIYLKHRNIPHHQRPIDRAFAMRHICQNTRRTNASAANRLIRGGVRRPPRGGNVALAGWRRFGRYVGPMMLRPISYKRRRFPPGIIAHAVWIYFRFPSSLRLVEEMPLERGILVTHESIWRWTTEFGAADARGLRRKAPIRHDVWHRDEVVISINSEKRYLWHAVDQEGYVLNEIAQIQRLSSMVGIATVRLYFLRRPQPFHPISLSTLHPLNSPSSFEGDGRMEPSRPSPDKNRPRRHCRVSRNSTSLRP
jgi:hypothetical protein